MKGRDGGTMRNHLKGKRGTWQLRSLDIYAEDGTLDGCCQDLCWIGFAGRGDGVLRYFRWGGSYCIRKSSLSISSISKISSTENLNSRLQRCIFSNSLNAQPSLPSSSYHPRVQQKRSTH